MSLVKDAIQSMIQKGKIQHDFEMNGTKITMEVLTTEEQLLADSLVDPEKIKDKYGADQLNTFRDTIEKYRTIAQIAFSIKKVNGKSPVDTKATLSDQFVQRIEFRDELNELDVVMLDLMIGEYRRLIDKQRSFLEKVEENAKK